MRAQGVARAISTIEDSAPGAGAEAGRPVGATPIQNHQSFRSLLGRYPTGVVLVTAVTESGPVGIAMNSFTSVSLTPPLVSFCAATTSETWSRLRHADGFAINILGDAHEDVCRLFSRHGADRFGQHSWDRTPAGHPLLPDALGWIDATYEDIHRAGDHDLVIARAGQWSDPRDGGPLVFLDGQFHSLGAMA